MPKDTAKAANEFPGFDADNWRTFERNGMLVLPGAIEVERAAALVREVDRISALLSDLHGREMPRFARAAAYSEMFLSLIDDPLHFGFAYDLFGELTSLLYSHAFTRAPGHVADNAWHFDGPRVTTHHAYATRLPLVLKVGWWLTDLSCSDSGNFVYLPGSHSSASMEAAGSFRPMDGEILLKVPPGSITIMHGGLWHRVLANRSTVTRRNLFFAYAPSWLAPQERYNDLLDAPMPLSRRRRILLRAYSHPHEREAPPDEDVPLLEGAKPLGTYGPGVRAGHRRYPLRIERLLG